MAKNTSLETAVQLCCQNVTPRDDEVLSLETTLGRTVSRHIYSPVNVPGFARSKVDGFAISSEDLAVLPQKNELCLYLSNVVTAGEICDSSLQPGNTFEVMAGAMLPSGTAAVVKAEDVTRNNGEVIISGDIRPGQGIEEKGSKIQLGSLVLSAGQVIDSEFVEKICSLGLKQVQVHQIPRVFIINSGSELLLPGEKLRDGMIYASNFSYLKARIIEERCNFSGGSPGVKDDRESLAWWILRGAKSSDIILVTGGTGSGSHDFMSTVLKDIKADLLFKGIECRPGRNVAAALVNGVILINLPGIPAAAGMLFDVLVKPVLRKLKGVKPFDNKWLKLILYQPISRIIYEQRSLCRGELVMKDGLLMAVPTGGTGGLNVVQKAIIDLKAGQGHSRDMVKVLLK